jgi:xanthine dehydrogenase accessory factor
VEGITGTRVQGREDLEQAWARRQIGVMVDPAWKIIGDLKPDIVIDAILAKRNLGTVRDEAPVVIGVGPGFSAPDVVHAAVESNRGANLGRAIFRGATEAHTGIPAVRAGYSWERVLRAPAAGRVRHVTPIGSTVHAGGIVLYVGQRPVMAAIDGTLRGLIGEIEVCGNEKVGDIEPRPGYSCHAISDKAVAIGIGVLDAVRYLLNCRTSLA